MTSIVEAARLNSISELAAHTGACGRVELESSASARRVRVVHAPAPGPRRVHAPAILASSSRKTRTANWPAAGTTSPSISFRNSIRPDGSSQTGGDQAESAAGAAQNGNAFVVVWHEEESSIVVSKAAQRIMIVPPDSPPRTAAPCGGSLRGFAAPKHYRMRVARISDRLGRRSRPPAAGWLRVHQVHGRTILVEPIGFCGVVLDQIIGRTNQQLPKRGDRSHSESSCNDAVRKGSRG